MIRTASDLIEVLEATWPAARSFRCGPWTLREGKGGGKRVSAATASDVPTGADIDLAELEMAALGQTPAFCIRDNDARLDEMLADRGYDIVDPVTIYVAPVRSLSCRTPPRVSGFAIWPPLSIMNDIWESGGIGPKRRDVMARAAVTKTAILARHADRPAGTAFVACHRAVGMVHAVWVQPHSRRRNVASNIMTHAAIWAETAGAEWLSVVVTDQNLGANALYSAMGMSPVGHYHYRQKQDGEPA